MEFIESKKLIQKKYAQMVMLQFSVLVSIPSYAAIAFQMDASKKMYGILGLTLLLGVTSFKKRQYKKLMRKQIKDQPQTQDHSHVMAGHEQKRVS